MDLPSTITLINEDSPVGGNTSVIVEPGSEAEKLWRDRGYAEADDTTAAENEPLKRGPGRPKKSE